MSMLQRMYTENSSLVPYSGATSTATNEVGPKKLDMLFYRLALRKNKWLIIFFTALVTCLAALYALTVVPVYAAQSTLLIESQKANIISVEALVGSEQESLDYYGTQYAVLRSRALTERVLENISVHESVSEQQFAELINLDELTSDTSGMLKMVGIADSNANPVNNTEPTTNEGSSLARRLGNASYNKMINQFRESLTIAPVVRTKLVTIRFESTDPVLAALVANEVAEQYIESDLEQRQSRKTEASQWMEDRLGQLKRVLDNSENALLAYKKDFGLIDLSGDVSRLSDQQLLFASNELAAAKNELSVARGIYNKTQGYKSSSPNLLETLPFVKNDVSVRSANTDLGIVQRELSELKNRYGAKHPIIVDAQSRIGSLRSNLDGHIARAVATFENDYQLLQLRVSSLEANVSSSKSNIQAIGQQKVTLDSLQREAEASRDQYNRLFDRITDLRTTDGLDEANALLTERAWVPSNPVKPNKLLIIGIALLGSLLIAATISIIKEFMDNTVNRTVDIEERLNTKLLGVVPLVSSGFMRRKSQLPISPDSLGSDSETFSEAINTCRTAFTTGTAPGAKVILVTSSVPDEGKSTIALNLAHSFGQLERTLLIDCDLRRPSIAKSLGMPVDSIGLSNLLKGESSKSGAPNFTVNENFHCLMSGPPVDNPLELLSSEKFSKGLENLRKRYDRIIIDSPPTDVVSDATVLGGLSDCVLYVVKPGQAPIHLVKNGLSRLTEANATVAGICMSQVDIEKARSRGDIPFHGFGINYQTYKMA